MESILTKILIEILDLPIKLLKWPILWLFKKIYPLKKLEGEIFIHPRSDTPISFQISAKIPTVVIGIGLTNAALLNIVLKKLCIENLFIDSTPMLSGLCFNENGNIARGTEKMFFQHFELNEYKVKELQRIKSERAGTTTSSTLHITAYFEVKPYGELKKFYQVTTACNVN